MAKKKPSPLHPLSLFFLLLPLLLCLSARAKAKLCPPCGSTSVPFPLSTGAGCGDPSYKIRCDNATKSLFFDALNGSSYPVTSISTSTQRLVIRPAAFVSRSSCVTTDLSSQGIQLNSSLPFNVSSSNTIMLLNCTARLLLSPLNCSSNSLCHVYANGTSDASACRSLPICCTFVAGGSSTSYSIRASGTGCSAIRSFVNLDAVGTPVAQWGERAGVELQWASPREPVCGTQADCEAGSNATCRADPSSSGTIRRCFCIDSLRWDPFSGVCVNNVTISSSKSNHGPLIAGILSGLGAAAVVTVAGFLLYRRQRRIREARERLAKERQDILNANNSSGRSAKHFTAREIKRATSNFAHDNLLGSGGYGDVFKGILADGTPVAVKCAKLGNVKSTEQVLNEVRVLSQVNHRSLVRLLGCCVDLDQPLMVYEFIPNGTLFDHLHGLRPLLPWRRRLAIAHQTAEGLAYLHSSAMPPIYHRDVKSSNILLDDKLNAKVADFGLSRLAEPGISHVSTCAQGTLGYLDPEYYRNYQLTDKSDVYSYGVVLLELLTSQKAIDFNRGPDDVNLAVHVQRNVEEEKLMDTVDGALKEGATQVELDTMKALGFLAMGCLEEKRQNRPSMKEVAEEIEYIINILDAGGVEKRDSA
ncbi:wall-associated receptor kinase-like 20 [Musa acuminata AAA Group]|uniref:wall-associated receptor kinase-like 20 n=1 Tax=Musa acuminata AAA Group TaxID=214697 RepID=UPI0031DC10A3